MIHGIKGGWERVSLVVVEILAGPGHGQSVRPLSFEDTTYNFST
jgi:hypothetical protein